MKTSIFAAVAMLSATASAVAAPQHKDALDDTTDMFGLVTPDRLLPPQTRRQWLDLHPVLAKVYWTAWDCKGKPCDTKQRAHYRAVAKLISRTDHDPKPLADTSAAANP